METIPTDIVPDFYDNLTPEERYENDGSITEQINTVIDVNTAIQNDSSGFAAIAHVEGGEAGKTGTASTASGVDKTRVIHAQTDYLGEIHPTTSNYGAIVIETAKLKLMSAVSACKRHIIKLYPEKRALVNAMFPTGLRLTTQELSNCLFFINDYLECEMLDDVIIDSLKIVWRCLVMIFDFGPKAAMIAEKITEQPKFVVVIRIWLGKIMPNLGEFKHIIILAGVIESSLACAYDEAP